MLIKGTFLIGNNLHNKAKSIGTLNIDNYILLKNELESGTVFNHELLGTLIECLFFEASLVNTYVHTVIILCPYL